MIEEVFLSEATRAGFTKEEAEFLYNKLFVGMVFLEKEEALFPLCEVYMNKLNEKLNSILQLVKGRHNDS